MPKSHRQINKYADRADQLKTLLVIGLCLLAAVAVVFGLIYDKSRWA